MKNMQYIPTVEKKFTLSVDYLLLITALVWLAFWREQSKRESQRANQSEDDLPVIAF